MDDPLSQWIPAVTSMVDRFAKAMVFRRDTHGEMVQAVKLDLGRPQDHVNGIVEVYFGRPEFAVFV